MANKINEIVDVINNGEVDEELSARVDSIEDDIDVTSLYPNQKINDVVINTVNNVDAIYQGLSADINKTFNYVEDWELVDYDGSSNLFTDGVLDKDIIIKLETHNSSEYPGFENAEYYNYIPKGIEIVNDIPITNFKRVSANNYFITTVLISASALEVNNQSVTLNTTFYNISTNESLVVAPSFDKSNDYPTHNKLLIYTRY